MRAPFARAVVIATLSACAFFVVTSNGCTIFLAGQTPCDIDGDCEPGALCIDGFCAVRPVGVGEGEGEPGEGEGETGEGEGETGEGEGEGEEGEGETGEGEGETGEGDGEGEGEPPIFLCGEAHDVPAWFDVNFPFRVPLAFCDTGAPDANVEGLPTTVILDDAAFPEISSIAADGRDVIFVDQSEAPLLLPYERQLYVDNDFAVFHVRVPSFNPSTGRDDVWMYFGSGDNVERSNAAATYPDYSSVWHLDDAGSLLRDAISGVNLPLAAFAGNINTGVGVFGGGIDHFGFTNDGVGSFALLQPFVDAGGGQFNAAPPPTPPPSASASFSFMAQPFSFSSGGGLRSVTLFLSELNTPGSPGLDDVSIFSAVFNDGSMQVFVPSSAGAVFASSAPNLVPLDVFRHQSLSWEPSGIVATFDGNVAIVSTAVPNASFPVENIVLGMTEQNNNGSFNGVIDEVRISNVPRAAAFFRAEKQAYSGLLFERGAVEAR